MLSSSPRFLDQRLLDPGAGRDEGVATSTRILHSMEVTRDQRVCHYTAYSIHPTQGWLTITNSTPGHSGNYSCVPSYTTPDWVTVHVIRGQNQEEGDFK